MKKTREGAHLVNQDRLSYTLVVNNSKIPKAKSNKDLFLVMAYLTPESLLDRVFL